MLSRVTRCDIRFLIFYIIKVQNCIPHCLSNLFFSSIFSSLEYNWIGVHQIGYNKEEEEKKSYMVSKKKKKNYTGSQKQLYRVSNATVSVANVENAHHSTRQVWLSNSCQKIDKTWNMRETMTFPGSGYFPRQPWGTFWGQRTCTRFSATEKAYLQLCKWASLVANVILRT